MFDTKNLMPYNKFYMNEPVATVIKVKSPSSIALQIDKKKGLLDKQIKEKEADEDITHGRIKGPFKTVKDFMKGLK